MSRKVELTPIEAAIQEKTDRRKRWVAKERQKGITRVTVRVHVDDADRVREFAAELLRGRGLA